MRRLLASVLAVTTLVVLPAGRGSAAGSFTFYGSGWGHGLGLSQWGAYGLAQEGWNRRQILTHFYSDTKVAKAAHPPQTLRIGLAQGRSRFRLAAESADVDLVLGDPKKGDVVATIPDGETWTVRAKGTSYQIDDADKKQVGDLVGGADDDLFAVFAPSGARVHVTETGHTYARGWLEFNLYDCQPDCVERLINTLPPQPYLYGLGEVPSSWPNASLQAQAIAARTYAFVKAASSQHRSDCNCALYASSADQVFVGWDKEGGPDGDRWVAAVDATDDLVVEYKGDLIEAFYTSSSGGWTENNENVWGGTPIAYLRGVCDPGDYTTANPNAVWQVTKTVGQVTRALDLGIGTVTGFSDAVRGVSGRIVEITVKGETGTATISGATLRSSLGLSDDRVWINRNRQVTGEIRGKYDAIDCAPGLPTSKQVQVAGGQRQTFEDGVIYFKDGLGAHELSGDVLAFYLDKGGPGGSLGFPTSDVERLQSGSTRARFEGGTITCKPSGDCSVS
jgi:SpoIID/LytB domain protein